MNKIYDKLLLAVAVLILAGGIFLYQQKSSEAPSQAVPADAEPGDNPYLPEPVPTSVSTEATWPAAPEQSTGWLYQVFTPPKIYINAEGDFVDVPIVPIAPPPPFDIYLAEIVRKPYRIQLEGYIEEDRSDPNKTLLLMFDEEAQKQVRARPGDVKADAEFELLKFEIERIRDGDNNIEVKVHVTILDQRTGEEVVLIDGERRYESEVTVVLRSRSDSNFEVTFSEAPSQFEGPIGQYTLKQINLEESSVTVEKQGTEEFEAEVKTLKTNTSEANTVPKKSAAGEVNDAVNDVFDLMN